MTDIASMEALLARVEAATGPDREIDHLFQVLVCNNGRTGQLESVEAWVAEAIGRGWNSPYFTASIDAIVGLIKSDLGWYWRAGYGSVGEWVNGRLMPGWCHLNRVNSNHCEREDEATGWASTPELACCAAFLRAKIAMEPKP